MTDSYDDTFAELDRINASNAAAGVKPSLAVAAKTNPDQFAQARQISGQTGLPVDTVERDMGKALELANQGKFDDAYFLDHPLTAQFLTDPDIAKLSHDDIDNLSWWEKQGKAIKQGWQQGRGQVESSYVGYRQLMGTATPEDVERADFIDQQKQQDFGLWGPEKIGSSVAQTLPMWIRSAEGGLAKMGIGSIAGATAASLLKLPPALGFKAGASAGFSAGTTTEMMNMEMGSAFREYLRPDENGAAMDVDVARGAAMTVGFANGVLENIGFKTAIEQVPGAANAKKYLTKEGLNAALKIPTVRNALLSMGKAVGKTMAIEGVTEATQEANTMIGRAVGNIMLDRSMDNATAAEFWDRWSKEVSAAGGFERVAAAGEMGMWAGSGFAMPNASVGAAMDIGAVKIAQRNKARFDAMAEKARESKLRERDPEAFGQHVDAVAKDAGMDTVYVDANALKTLYQANPKAQAALLKAIPDIQQQLDSAVSDIAIPTKDFSAYIAPSEFYPDLSEHIRFNPDDLTLAEAHQIESEAPGLLAQLGESFVESDSLKAVKDSVFAGLSKKYDRGSAERMTRVFIKQLQTIADRSGLGIERVNELFDLRIKVPLPPILTERGNVDTALDPLIDALKGGKDFSESEIYGTNFLSALVKAGGLVPSGELDAMDAKKARHGLVNKNGMTPDQALVWAYERGYLKEKPQQFEDTYNPNAPDASRIYEMIAQSLRGDNIYTDNADTAKLAFNENVEQLRRFLYNKGIDPATATREEMKAAVKSDTSSIVGGQVMEQALFPESNRISNIDRNGAMWASIQSENPAISPDSEMVTVYRATVGDEIRNGDFVAINKDIAEQHLESLSDRGEKGKIIEKQVNFSDLLMANDATEFVFSPSAPNILLQSADDQEKNLYVFHNLSAENLLYAKELGGIAVPSLGIGRVDKGAVDSYGEITLIADKEILKSSGAKTFNADVYSPRHPEAVYVVDRAKVEKLQSELTEASRGAGDLRNIDMSNLADNGAKELLRSDAFKYKFLIDNGIKIKTKPRKAPSTIKAGVKFTAPTYQLEEDEKFISLASKHYSKIVDEARKSDAALADELQAGFFSDGKLERNFVSRFATDVNVYRKSGGIDSAATRDAISKAIRDKELFSKFEQHAIDTFNSIVKGKKIFKGFTSSGDRKYIPYNLENIVKEMTSSIRGGEGFNYGAGSIRSAFAAELKSIDEIKNRRGEIVSNEEMEKVKKESADKLSEVLDSLKPYYRFDADGYGYADDASNAIAEGENGLREAFKLDAKGRKIVSDFVSYLQNLPTEYFETKIGRAVDVGEFSAAVVPDNVSEKVIDFLKERGITDIRKYKHDDSIDRTKVISGIENLLFQNQNNPQGSISFIDRKQGVPAKRQFDVTLLDGANLSTFFHESAHFFLELMGDIAEQENVSAEFSKDYATLLSWLGVESRDQLERVHHEKMAHGYELYLFEGKAPSPDLIPLFQRFGQWMQSIYKSFLVLKAKYKELYGQDLELTDEVRGVFDRMIASDQEIEAARNEINSRPLSAEMLKKLGASDKDAEAYNAAADVDRGIAESAVFRRVFNYLKRQKTAEWNEARAVVKAEVRRDLNEDQVYRAISIMRNGTLPDGSALPEGMRHVWMDKDELESTYGKFVREKEGVAGNRIMTKLRNLNLYRKTGGFSPDFLAPLFGYRSGDELIQAIMNAPAYGEYVEAETDRRMAERFPDPLTDGTIHKAAMDAVHNEHSGEVMIRELNLINQKAGKQARTQRVFKAMAEGQIGRMKISDIRPGVYKAAEARESRLTENALVKNDFDAAAEHKRRQVLNHYLYTEAVKAQDEAEKLADWMVGQSKDSARAKLGKAGGDFLDQMDGILDTYDFRRRSKREIESAKSLASWYDDQVKQTGFAPFVSDRVMRDVTLGNKVNYRSLTVDELRGVVDTAKSIQQAGKNMANLLIAGEQIELDAAKQNLADAITSAFKQRKWSPVDPNTIRTWEKLRNVGAASMAYLLRLETLANWVDGDGNVNGWFHKLIMRPANEAAAAKNDLQSQYVKKIHDLIVAYHKDGGDLSKEVHIRSINEPMTKAGILAVMLNMGNAGNIQRVMDGRGWNESVLTEIKSHVTKRDMDFVQSIWDTVGELWPQIEALEKRVTGIAPPKVQAQRLSFPFGDYAGGYYPIVYDRSSPEWAAMAKEMDGGSLMQPTLLVSRTQQGHTETRVAQFNVPIMFDLSVIPRHLDDVIHDLTHREFVINTTRLLKSYRVQSALKSTIGPDVAMMINDKIKQIASDSSFDADRAMTKMAKFSRAVKGRVSMMAMGLSSISGIKQSLGNTSTLEVMTADTGSAKTATEYLARGHMEVLRNWGDSAKAANMLSGEMRGRMDSMDADIRSHMQEALRARITPSKVGALIRGMNDVQRSAYFMIQYVQTYSVDLQAFWAGYHYAMDNGMASEDAAAYGESVVRRSQGAGGIKDISLIENKPFIEWFTLFYSYFSARVNRDMSMMRDAGKARAAGQLAAQAPVLIARAMFLYVAAVILEDLVNQAVGRVHEDDDDWAIRNLKSIAINLFAGIPGLRDLARYLIAPKGALRISPVQGVAEGITALPVDMINLASGEEVDGAKLVLDAMTTAGYAMKLPLSEPRKRVDYLIEEMGDEDPVSVQKFMWHMLTGAQKE